MATATTMTLDEFLALPETEPPSEFACGRIVEKPMPTWVNSRLAARLTVLFEIYFVAHDEGYVNVELRHASREERRAFVPDVSIARWERAPRTASQRPEGAIEQTPDIAIEISSPDDRLARIADKPAFYPRAGVPLALIVDPDERTLTAYTPGRPPTVFGEADTADAAPVLSAFRLPLHDLFGVLDGASNPAPDAAPLHLLSFRELL